MAVSPQSEDTLALFERRAHCAVHYEGKIYFWGGIIVETEYIGGGDDSEDSSDDESESESDSEPVLVRTRKNLPHTEKKLIDVYDICSQLWWQYPTTGDAPPPDYGASVAVLHDHIYHFGGYGEFHFRNDLYRLNLSSLHWEKIQPKTDLMPFPVYLTVLLPFANSLITFGGMCPEVPSNVLSEVESEYFQLKSIPSSSGSHNAFWEFNTDHMKWSHHSVANRIKPIYGHQATCFHKQDVLVFGGKICDVFSNHIYLLDMQAKVFKGPIQPPDETFPWPNPRILFSLSCLVEPDLVGTEINGKEVKQNLLVVWGKGPEVRDDCWILTVDQDLEVIHWTKVLLPLAPRYWHSATVWLDAGLAKVFLFGGNFPSSSERFGDMPRTEGGYRKWRGDFRVLQFGVQSLWSLCANVVWKNGHIRQHALRVMKKDSAICKKVLEFGRKSSYYKPIGILSGLPKDLSDGRDDLQHLTGVGFGWREIIIK